MSEIVVHIKNILFNFNGILSRGSEHKIPEELEELHRRIYSDEGMSRPSDDKINLSLDSHNLREDFKKAVYSYKQEKDLL
jgi:hypothetical protein